ncbi:flagellar motor stator protein MotA [Anaplasmataceae bacterium AB001_6]|nr:flagellar motor stator protein MotA [Anaplasmataceae bacterium AB001_6]
MNFIIGVIFTCVTVFGTFALIGGNLKALMQPGEFGIIFGAAIGAFIIGNPPYIIKHVFSELKLLFKSEKYNKKYYTELLVLLFNILKTIKVQNINVLEKDIDDPSSSTLFNEYKLVSKNKHLINFLCDYLRILTMGVEEYSCIEDIMHVEIETVENEHENYGSALHNMADGLPAIGIVAAVLGVIKTMANIDQPPAVLGKLIAGALVGTFLGVLLAYCFVGPVSNYLHKIVRDELFYMECIKNAIVSHMQGKSPVISVEIARKSLPERIRPDFKTIEDKLYS